MRRKVDGYWVDDDAQDADQDEAWRAFWKTLNPELARVSLGHAETALDSRHSA